MKAISALWRKLLRRSAVPSSVTAALRGIVGPDHVFTGDAAEPYCREPTGNYTYPHDKVVVVCPANTSEVSAVLKLLHAHRIPCVPRSGGTGLVGASVPRDGVLVVLSLRRLRYVGQVSKNHQVTVGAGITLEELHELAAKHNRRYGADCAERNAQMGGMIATNLGGEHVLFDGMTRDQLVGIEYVLADGTVMNLRDLHKRNDGYHIDELLPGTEGTVAVITAARVQLLPQFAWQQVMVMATGTVREAVNIVQGLQEAIPANLHAAEIIDASSMEHVCQYIRKPNPFGNEGEYGAYVFLELLGYAGQMEDALAAIYALTQGDHPVVPEPVLEAALFGEELWEFRKNTPSAFNIHKPVKLDVSLAPEVYADGYYGARDIVTALVPEAESSGFGHAGDGTWHFQFLGITGALRALVTQKVLEYIAGIGGAISSEHGIGCQKAAYLHLSRSREEINLMHRLRRACDPRRILNRGAVLAGKAH